MIDHLFGRPNPSWKRTQVFLVLFFWIWRLVYENPGAPRVLWLRRINRYLKRFTPWQIIVSTLCTLYASRNLDKIVGLGSPEPLARLYSPSYYRAIWITTGLDAGFATAMSIRPKWLRDICSLLFSAYYIIYANEADEKLRRFRAVPTVEMLRTTWEKTTNPYIRLITSRDRVPVGIRRKVLLSRPKSSKYDRPITAYLFFAPAEHHLCDATDLILDYPGGGFVAMSPEHHEERLRLWARKTGKPVVSIDYGKAPEYPYPFAIDEVYDAYCAIVQSKGTLIGMSGKKLNVIISGDSAGGTLAVNVVTKILEHNASLSHLAYPTPPLPLPLAVVLNYAALDFNFTSWMSQDHLRVLRSEQSSGNLPGLLTQKDHFSRASPLSMVGDQSRETVPGLRRQRSWLDSLKDIASNEKLREEGQRPGLRTRKSMTSVRLTAEGEEAVLRKRSQTLNVGALDEAPVADSLSEDRETEVGDRPIGTRVRYVYPRSLNPVPRDSKAAPVEASADQKYPQSEEREVIGTRLTMTSRTGFFQDRIISPSMMRAMAILYIGPHRNPDFATDYHVSPILTPSELLAQFPPLLLQCGEKDPFVDDTVIFAGRVREAKRRRQVELDLAIAGKSARFGEELRMSTGTTQLAAERERLGEDQMVLFSDWSHGYLQMGSLMKEAKGVIEDLGEWIEEAFERYETATVATKRQLAGTISERELMRRRRLLDAHMLT